MKQLQEMLHEFWDALTGVLDDNKAKLIRMSCFTMLFLGMLWAAVNYFRADRIADTNLQFENPYSTRNTTPEEDQAAMEKFEAIAKTITEMRQGGEAIVSTISAMHTRPFNIGGYNEAGLEDLTNSTDDITRDQIISAMSEASSSGDVPVTAGPSEEPQGPGILLKAVMFSGRTSSAVIDVADTKGLIVHRGEEIPGGFGRVVRIRPSGITVRANRREYNYELSKIELIKSMR